MDKKLSNYHSTHTEESIVGVLVNAFLPLVVQIAGAAASAASDSSKKSDLGQYNQFMNDCQVLLSKKIGLLMSKLAGENKEQDQKMLNSLISMMQPVAPQNKEKQVNALPQVSAANELPVSPNENKEITHWPEYLAKMAGVTKWKELDLALIGNLTKKVAHDIYQVDFYNRQDLKDDMWPQFRNVLQLEVNIKKSLQQVKERKKKKLIDVIRYVPNDEAFQSFFSSFLRSSSQIAFSRLAFLLQTKFLLGTMKTKCLESAGHL